MPTVSNSTQTAKKLIAQLNADTAMLDYKPSDGGKSSTVTAGKDNPGGWQDPIPLTAVSDTPVFPVHCLPEVLRAFVLAVAEHTQTPVDMSAVASLGVSSACLQGKYLVQGKIGHTEPLNNYYVEVAKPGERKSAVCAIFEEPFKAYEKRKNEAFALDIAHSANIRQVLEKEMEALKNAVAKGKKTYADMEAKQAEINNHQDIKPICLICGDVTPEALTSLLADNYGRMAMFSAEGGIFDVMRGLYSQVTNIDAFLKAHCGDSIRVDRKGRPPEFIENPCLTTLLFIQPSVLQELVGNDTFKGRGLVARFLYVYPQSTVGGRKYKTQPISEETQHKYNQLCENMLDDCPKAPQIITLSQEAEAVSERFYNELEPRIGRDGDLEHMADWAGKLHGTVLRIAGLLHIVSCTSINGKDFLDIPFESVLYISGETMTAAVELGYYFLSHAQVCYGFMGMDEGMENAKYMLSQLEKKNPLGEFRPSDIWLLCKGKRFKKVSDIAPSLELLTDYGYIKPIPGANLYEGGRPKGDRYILNPKHFSALPQP